MHCCAMFHNFSASLIEASHVSIYIMHRSFRFGSFLHYFPNFSHSSAHHSEDTKKPQNQPQTILRSSFSTHQSIRVSLWSSHSNFQTHPSHPPPSPQPPPPQPWSPTSAPSSPLPSTTTAPPAAPTTSQPVNPHANLEHKTAIIAALSLLSR